MKKTVRFENVPAGREFVIVSSEGLPMPEGIRYLKLQNNVFTPCKDSGGRQADAVGLSNEYVGYLFQVSPSTKVILLEK